MAYSFTKVNSGGFSDGLTRATIEVTPDAATGDVTLSGASAQNATEIKAVLGIVPLTEDPAANAQVAVQAEIDSTDANKLNFKLWQATNSAAAAFKKFAVTVVVA